MFEFTRLWLFVTAALLLAVAPGPGMLYVLARSLAGGKREGVFSALGTCLGGMVHVFAAAAGVSVILARSAMAFAAVKYAGAAYLCFLGVRMILDARKPEGLLPEEIPAAVQSIGNPLWQGWPRKCLILDCVVLSVLHPAIRQSGRRKCVFSIRLVGNFFGGAKHFRRSNRNFAGWTDRKKDSLFGTVPPETENRNRHNHDWTGSVFGNQRRSVIPVKPKAYNSKIWWSWQSVCIVS